ncbi:MAG: hypothetical protein Q4A88_04630, partial [Clostridia bacterium]|nr:hypothetical protein [Clostridia bacterium]
MESSLCQAVFYEKHKIFYDFRRSGVMFRLPSIGTPGHATKNWIPGATKSDLAKRPAIRYSVWEGIQFCNLGRRDTDHEVDG